MTWLQTFLDKGLAPITGLAGVAMTLVFTGRREAQREKQRATEAAAERERQDKRERSARLRERRIVLYLDIRRHVQAWEDVLVVLGPEFHGSEQTPTDETLSALADELKSLNASVTLLAAPAVVESWVSLTHHVGGVYFAEMDPSTGQGAKAFVERLRLRLNELVESLRHEMLQIDTE
jgi:hypothetical protein